MAELYIGCSGFSYRHWRGTFYPESLPTKNWYAHYRSVFSTVELNVTFYRTPRAEDFDKWYAESEPGFSFAVKGSRYITHLKRLLDTESALEHFFTPVLHLKEKLKMVLWQLPPEFRCEPGRFREFLRELANYPVRNVFEFRNESWLVPEIVALCREHRVGLCMADHPAFLDAPPVTAEFVYLRRHGAQGNYIGEYSQEEVARDAQRIRRYLADRLDVFIYYNNDAGGAAPRNALQLRSLLAGAPQ